MKLSVYTSCSINYLPKAKVLSKTLKYFHPDAKITLLLSDRIPEWLDLSTLPFDQIWQPSDFGFDQVWVFKHNVMEICTAVKGKALERLMQEEEQFDYYLYLDPDVCVYNKLDLIEKYMDNAEIGLVPHITKAEDTDIGIMLTEISVTAHGIYNLGHLIIKKGDESLKFAKWWGDRLSKFCYDDKDHGLFTDQRWCDLVPAIFDKVKILKQPNLDVASWNIYGRNLEKSSANDMSSILIDGYPLLTYHYSGTGPTGVHRYVRDIMRPTSGVAAELERHYEELIETEDQSILENWKYGWDFFDNGAKITSETRKFYRRHIDLQQAFKDPFSVSEESNFYNWLCNERPTLVNFFKVPKAKLLWAFDDIFDQNHYLNTYPEVKEYIEKGEYSSAKDHYIKKGSALLYDPSLYFNSNYYYEKAHKNDGFILHSGKKIENTLLWHYLTVGLECGLEPIPFFDSREYIGGYPDLDDAVKLDKLSCPLGHFALHGDKEKRNPSARFNSQDYFREKENVRHLIDKKIVKGPLGAYLYNFKL